MKTDKVETVLTINSHVEDTDNLRGQFSESDKESCLEWFSSKMEEQREKEILYKSLTEEKMEHWSFFNVRANKVRQETPIILNTFTD